METNFNPKSILDFIIELDANNNRDWFLANKIRFDALMKYFKQLVLELSNEIERFDVDFKVEKPENYIFRIYKDLRFSKDKTPYKNHIAAYLCNGGRKSIRAGYYIHFEPNQCFIAGGLYKPETKILRAMQKQIYFHPTDFLKIVEDETFKSTFSGFMDDKILKVPKEFPADHAMSEYFKFKSFMVSKTFSYDEVCALNLQNQVIDGFKNLLPLTHFANTAIELIDENFGNE